MKSKRGIEFTIGTIIVIVLALIVLVILALGFTGGWGNLWGRMTDIFSSANVDSIRQGCSIACTTGATYDYCTLPRDVITKKADGSLDKQYTANEKNKDPTKPGPQTCKSLESAPFNFDSCTQITCTLVKCTDLKGSWKAACNAAKEITLTSQVTDTSDKGDNVACCKNRKCSDMGGTWQLAACDPNIQTEVLSANIPDISDKGDNVACCRPKSTTV